MILSDIEIIKLCSTSSPLISPFIDHKVINKSNSISHGLSSCGYDIRVGSSFTSLPNVTVNFRATDISIKPGAFLLAHSVETFIMPSNLVAFIHDKSSYARRGLAVQNTVIEPGWQGQLTLELTNHSLLPVLICPGSGIAQIIFHQITPCLNPYNGKYQHQLGVTLAK